MNRGGNGKPRNVQAVRLIAQHAAVPARRRLPACRLHVGAWRLTGELGRRMLDRRVTAGIVARVTRCYPPLAMALLHPRREPHTFCVAVGSPVVAITCTSPNSVTLVLRSSIRSTLSGILSREATYDRTEHSRRSFKYAIRTVRTLLGTDRPQRAPGSLAALPHSVLSPSTDASRNVAVKRHAFRPPPAALTYRRHAPGIGRRATTIALAVLPGLGLIRGMSAASTGSPDRQALGCLLAVDITAKATTRTPNVSRAARLRRLGLRSRHRFTRQARPPRHTTNWATESILRHNVHTSSSVRAELVDQTRCLPRLRLQWHRSKAELCSRAVSLPPPPPMPLIDTSRTTAAGATDMVEHARRDVTANVMERVESLVEKEVQQQMRIDSRQLRRIGEHVYADLGARIAFERERMGRT